MSYLYFNDYLPESDEEFLNIRNISSSNFNNENNLNLNVNFCMEETKEENNNKEFFCKSIQKKPKNEGFINVESKNQIKNILYDTLKLKKFATSNENEISENINYYNLSINNKIKELKKDLEPLGRKRNRSIIKGKQKNDNLREKHTKLSDDNILRKSKHIILESLFVFINKKIKEIYGNNEKKLLKINYKQKCQTKIEYNKKFLNKSLGDIVSDNITKKYKHYPENQNEKVINELKNDEKCGNPNYFRNLFELSFLQCIKHFRGDEKILELEGLEGIEIIKDKFKDDKDYLNSLEDYIMNFETNINNKKGKFSKIAEK